jgi:rod shape-determining protein MreD
MIVRAVRLSLLLVFLVTLQTALFPYLRIGGAVPALGLVAAVALAVTYGPELGAAFGFAAGLAGDMFLQTPLGLGALTVGLTAYMVGRSQNALNRPAWWFAPLLAAAAGIVEGALFIGLGALVGQDQLWAMQSVRLVLASAVYDGIVALVLFPLAVAVGRPDPRAHPRLGAPGY